MIIFFSKKCCDIYLADVKHTHRIIVVSGTANGADKLGERYVKAFGYEIERHPALWSTHGKAAGYIRNEEMAKISQALIAFCVVNSAGTTHMCRIANKYGLKIRKVDITREG